MKNVAYSTKIKKLKCCYLTAALNSHYNRNLLKDKLRNTLHTTAAEQL